MNSKLPEPKIFCVLTSPRSGSSWLIDLLDSHPDIGTFGEIFLDTQAADVWYEKTILQMPRYFEFVKKHSYSRPFSIFRFLDSMKQYSQGERVLGFKLMYSHLIANPEILLKMIFSRFKIIHLVRKNYLDTLLSRWTMRKTGNVHSKKALKQPRIYVNPKSVKRILRWIESRIMIFQRLLTILPIPVLRVNYEELRLSPVSTLNKITKFLNLAPYSEYESEFRKINTTKKRDRIQNIDELYEALQGTKYLKLLDDLE